jgi:nitrate reductase gamma subunit
MEPAMAVVTTGFHAALILTPLTVLAHALLFEQSWGTRPPSAPEALTDILTLVVLGLGFFLLYRRIRVARVRSITTPTDIILLAVVLAPFLTGFLAYHQWMPYRPMVVAHMLSGELMLVCIPFTRLSHALFFFLVRICLGSEYSFTRGSRVWR